MADREDFPGSSENHSLVSHQPGETHRVDVDTRDVGAECSAVELLAIYVALLLGGSGGYPLRGGSGGSRWSIGLSVVMHLDHLGHRVVRSHDL